MTAALKCDPRRLPKPLCPPTKAVRVPEKVDIPWEAHDWQSDWKVDKEKMEERRRRAVKAMRQHYAVKNAYTPEQEEQLIRMYKSGASFKEIADSVGKSERAVKAKIDRMRKVQNFECECRLRSEYGGYTPAQDAVIREMRAQGKSYKAIGEQIGKSKEAVRKRYNMIGG